MEDLIERFRQRFGKGDTCRTEAMTEFWERCQGPDEPTGKYVEDKARFTMHGTIQGMHDDVCRDVLLQRPTTLEELCKAADIADASTRHRGPGNGTATMTGGQLADLAALMAHMQRLMSSSNRQPTDPGAMADDATTNTAGKPITDDRAINIRVVMPDGDSEPAAGCGRGPGPHRGQAHGGCGGWNGRPTPTTFP